MSVIDRLTDDELIRLATILREALQQERPLALRDRDTVKTFCDQVLGQEKA